MLNVAKATARRGEYRTYFVIAQLAELWTASRKELSGTTWSGTMLNVAKATARRAKYRMYIVIAQLAEL
ncbi:hypothetical protein GCM10027098_34090 [Bowmanella dokdonensis]